METLMGLAVGAAALALFVLASDVALVRTALQGAPEPHWSQIRDTLGHTRLVSGLALWIGARLTPPADEEA